MIVFHIEPLHGRWSVTDEAVAVLIDATVAEAGLPTEPPGSFFGADYELSVALSDDRHVRRLNRDYRGHDRATNVLSFPSEQIAPGELPPHPMLGDLVFAHETCAREAQAQNKGFDEHFAHLFVHGLLHLYGYDHSSEAEAQVMEALERSTLARLGIADPYAQMDAARESRADHAG